MTRNTLSFILLLVVASACVPNRKVVFLQHDDVKKRKDIPKDTVLRVHPLDVKEYRIQPLDILSIQFESLTSEDFDFFSKSAPSSIRGGGGASGGTSAINGIMVDTQGEIEYPVVGKIKIAGLTIFEAQTKLQEIALQYLKDVVVRVRMLNFRFTLLGEVNAEKTVVSTNPRLTMMEAIAQGGGLSELADRANVKVLRQIGNETHVFYVNLLEEEFIESPNYYVQQNDVIIVPPLQQRPFKRYFVSNLGMITTTISAVLFFLTISDKL